MRILSFNVPRLSYKSYTPASTRLIDEMLKAYQPMATLKMDERPMDMQIKSAAYMPFYFEYAPMLKRQSPMPLWRRPRMRVRM